MIYIIYRLSACPLALHTAVTLLNSQISGNIVGTHTQADHTTSDPASVDEPPPAVLDVLEVDLPDHVSQRQRSPSAATDEEQGPGAGGPSRGAQKPDLRDGQAAEDLLSLGVVLEGDALNAGLGIVPDVHVGVDHVVEHRPGDVAGVQEPGGRQRGTIGQQVHAQGREAHDGAPGEGEAEHELRVVRHALGQGVRGHEQQAGDSVEETARRELQEDAESSQELSPRVGQSLEGGDGTPGDGP